MIIVDASLLIAHFSASDDHHTAADMLLVRFIDEPLAAHPLTLAEMLVGAATGGKATERRDDILRLGVEQWNPDQEEPLRLAELRVSTGLKLPDCCVLSVATVTGGSIITFDRALGQAAEMLGLRVISALEQTD